MTEETKTGGIRNIWIILCLIFLWPVGMYLVFTYRPKWFNKLWLIIILALYALLWSFSIISGLQGQRSSSINIASEYTFNCNATFDKYTDAFECGEREISGDYTKHNWVALVGHSSDGKLTVNDNQFSVVLSQTFDLSVVQTASYSENAILEKYGTSTVKLVLYSNWHGRNAAEKEITIHWQFTDDDLQLINDKHLEWEIQEAERIAAEAKAEAERIAAEEAKLKAAEEKAEAERKAAEEKAEAERKAAEEAEQRQNSSSPGTSTPDEYGRVTGYCRDGYGPVTGNPSADGRANACYGHKGWDD